MNIYAMTPITPSELTTREYAAACRAHVQSEGHELVKAMCLADEVWAFLDLGWSESMRHAASVMPGRVREKRLNIIWSQPFPGESLGSYARRVSMDARAIATYLSRGGV